MRAGGHFCWLISVDFYIYIYYFFYYDAFIYKKYILCNNMKVNGVWYYFVPRYISSYVGKNSCAGFFFCLLLFYLLVFDVIQFFCQFSNKSQSALILFLTPLTLAIFTFMHLADAFIQSDLQCIQAIHFLCVFPGNRTHNLWTANAMF